MLVLLKMFLHLYADKGEDHEIPEKNNLYVMYDVCVCMCAGQSWASRVYLCHALHYWLDIGSLTDPDAGCFG